MVRLDNGEILLSLKPDVKAECKSSKLYYAPELLNQQQDAYNVQTDLYGVGMMLYLILHKSWLPFEVKSSKIEIKSREAFQKCVEGNDPLPLPV